MIVGYIHERQISRIYLEEQQKMLSMFFQNLVNFQMDAKNPTITTNMLWQNLNILLSSFFLFFFSCVATVIGVTVGGIIVVVLHDIIVDKMTYYFIILQHLERRDCAHFSCCHFIDQLYETTNIYFLSSSETSSVPLLVLYYLRMNLYLLSMRTS